jgi:hypothetical protein
MQQVSAMGAPQPLLETNSVQEDIARGLADRVLGCVASAAPDSPNGIGDASELSLL